MTVAVDESLGTIDAAPAPADSIAAPGAIPYQAVTDNELERFDGNVAPIPVALAGLFAGVFVATAPRAIQSLLAIGGAGVGLGDALFLAINALALGVAATAAVFAIRGKAEITRMLAVIRGRARIAIAPEIETPNSA